MSERPVSKPLAFGNSPKSVRRDSDDNDLQEVESSPSNHAKIPEESQDNNDAMPNISNNFFKILKTIDVNRYATKKTFAQGMLDIALLTTNASQLKYVLQVGNRHQYYKPMLYLVGLSIAIQIVQGVICVFLGSSLNINKEADQKRANRWNDIVLSMMVVTVAINIIISVFEMRDIDTLVASAKSTVS